MTEPALPHDLAAERRLIGSVATVPDLLSSAQLTPADFWDHQNAAAWGRLLDEIKAGHAIQTADFWEYISTDAIFLPEYITEDARRVRRAAYCRAVVEQLRDVARAAYAGEAETAASRLSVAARAGLQLSVDHLEPSGAIAGGVWDAIADPEAQAERIIPTGLTAWDTQNGGGLERGTLTIIMARPSMGKTALLVQVADYVSEHYGPVAVFSKEMTSRQWLLRMACRRARVSLLALKQRRVSEEQRQKVLDQIAALGSRKTLWIDDATPQTTTDVLAACERRGDLVLVLADHLRLFADTGENENKRLGAVSWGLKMLAKRLDLPVLAAAQLNRGVEAQGDKRPDLKDLRDSGEIEENADTVTALYRDSYYTQAKNDVTAELINRKARDGERNSLSKFAFLSDVMSFDPLARMTP